MMNSQKSTCSYLLRVEAVNLEQVIEDTSQLSAVRGGGLMALEAARGLCDGLKAVLPAYDIEPLSQGASVALLSINEKQGFLSWLKRLFQPKTDLKQKVVTSAKNWLVEKYPHHTFVVDIEAVTEEGGFNKARQAVLARNRFRQLQQTSLAVPKESAAVPCKFDDLRPATKTLPRGEVKDVPASRSVYDRFQHGSKKDELMRELLNLPVEIEFAEKFEDIVGDFRAPRLENKLAVIYLDGNSFSALQDGCEDPGELQRFDETLRDYRKHWLSGFLQAAWHDDDFCKEVGGNKRLRFELLLWGGDEMLLIVPAWKGLETLFDFYEKSAGWEWNGKPLTHAGALVFCHHKTPIDRMTALARELADIVKESPQGRKNNLFEYLALESVDYPAEPVGDYWRTAYGALERSRTPLHSFSSDLLESLSAFRDSEYLPRGKLLRAIRKLVAVDPDRPDLLEQPWSDFQTLLDDIGKGKDEARQAVDDLKAILAQCFPDQTDPWRWLHFTELWDYLAPIVKGERP